MREDLIGQSVGPYRLLEELGCGAMGAVFLAEDSRCGLRVAVKILSPLCLGDPRLVLRFREEARIVSLFAHPQIVRLSDFGEDPAQGLFLAMEYVPGPTLAAELRRRGRLPVPQVLDLVRRVGAALQYAHDLRVVHRDVKPANLLLHPEKGAMLTDFGIARADIGARLTPAGVVPGTPEYLSPEQILGEVATGASDQYSLGVVLFESLTGSLPFVAPDPGHLMHQQVYQDPSPPSDLRSDLPEWLDALVLRMLAKKPESRFKDLGEVARGLDRGALREEAPASDRTLIPRQIQDLRLLSAASGQEDRATVPPARTGPLVGPAPSPPRQTGSGPQGPAGTSRGLGTGDPIRGGEVCQPEHLPGDLDDPRRSGSLPPGRAVGGRSSWPAPRDPGMRIRRVFDFFRQLTSNLGTSRTDAELELDLVVQAGPQPGRRIRLSAPETYVGRGSGQVECATAILFDDGTVSAHQAVIRRGADGYVLDHLPQATNPTRVNGRRVTRHLLCLGDRIEFGSVAVDVQATELAPSALAPTPPVDQRLQEGTEYRPMSGAQEPTEARSMEELCAGALEVVRGPEDLIGTRFRLFPRPTTLGRAADCDVCLPDKGVSRCHAVISWEGGAPTLEHRSQTNPSLVNGVMLTGPQPLRQALRNGDEIQLADRIALRLDLKVGPVASAPPAGPSASVEPLATADVSQPSSPRAPEEAGGEDMLEMMRRLASLEKAIQEKFIKTLTFLDVDVVDSSGMKSRTEFEHRVGTHRIVLSFDLLRSYLERVVTRHRGSILNSNGDELMCCFESAQDGVDAALAMVLELDDFNRQESLIPEPFRLRVGLHTGRSTVDFQRGIAYSATLDTTGHLQKHCPVGGVKISGTTYQMLSRPELFEESEPLPKEEIPTWVWRVADPAQG